MVHQSIAAFRLGLLVAASSYFCWTYQQTSISSDVLAMHEPSQHFYRRVSGRGIGEDIMIDEGKLYLHTASNRQLLGNFEPLAQNAGVLLFLYSAAMLSGNSRTKSWALPTLPLVWFGVTASFPRVVAASNAESKFRDIGIDSSVVPSSPVVVVRTSAGLRRDDPANSTSSRTTATATASSATTKSITATNASSSDTDASTVGAGDIIGFIVMGTVILGFIYAVVKYVITPQENPKKTTKVSPGAEAEAVAEV